MSLPLTTAIANGLSPGLCAASRCVKSLPREIEGLR